MLITYLFALKFISVIGCAYPNNTQSEHLWAKYLTDWTFWNHVRTVAALAASAMFIVSLTK
jgi:uncharacterized membrane protein